MKMYPYTLRLLNIIQLFDNDSFEKITLFHCKNFRQHLALTREKHGNTIPCSSRIISELTPQICYHNNYRITNWFASYLGRVFTR